MFGEPTQPQFPLASGDLGSVPTTPFSQNSNDPLNLPNYSSLSSTSSSWIAPLDQNAGVSQALALLPNSSASPSSMPYGGEDPITGQVPTVGEYTSLDIDGLENNDLGGSLNAQDIAQQVVQNGIANQENWASPPTTFADYSPFVSGIYTVGQTGDVSFDILFDGGGYQSGQLALFSIEGMETIEPGSLQFIQEAARRALSNSEQGYVVFNDQTEGARFSGILGKTDKENFNSGQYRGPQTFKLRPGSTFAIMLVPNSTVQEVYENPAIAGSGRPLFSLATANPNDALHTGQVADVFGDGTTFVMEDLRLDEGSDRDCNDIIFKVTGARGYAEPLKNVIDPNNQWQFTLLGQEVLAYASTNDNPAKPVPGKPVRDPILPIPGIPQTTADQGGNSLTTPTSLEVSLTQDLIDQVSSSDLTDVYRVSSQTLMGTQFQVLQGQVSISYFSPSGQLLGSQIVSEGTSPLSLPTGLFGDVLLKIDSLNGTTATYVLPGFESQAPEPFNFQFEFGNGLTNSQQAIIQAAARSLEPMISQGLPSAIVDGKIIDDINIKIGLSNLDGANGTQAQTKIDFMRYGTLLPAQSIVQLDGADIAELERSGRLFSVVQHELLHALGFGNLWEAKGLVDYAKTPFARYTGQNAIQAFQLQGGSTNFIPLETNGDGSADLHWHEALFGDEIMTNDLNGTGASATISDITLASLEDLGYQVNRIQTPSTWMLGSSMPPDAESIFSEEDKQRLAELIAIAEAQPPSDIPTIIPAVDPTTISPTIWAHAERFDVNGEYYDWQLITVGNWTQGHTVWNYVLDRMTHPSKLDNRSAQAKAIDPRYWQFIVDRNRAFGIVRPELIYAGEPLYVPVWNANYEQKQEEERLRRAAELQQKEEEERQQRNRLEEAYRQSGQGGLEWYLAKPLPDFSATAPYETSVRDLVGSLVPDDYFRFTISRPGYVTLYLEDLLADADLYLYDSKNRLIAKSARSGITDEKIIVNLTPGTYMARVHSPGGVTTDYNLKVRFDGIPSRTQVGNQTSSGGKKPTFSDPRIERIFTTARDKFAAEQWAQAQPKINQLEKQKEQKQKELDALLLQAIAEQRARVYAQLDGVRNDIQGKISGGANNVRNVINGIADGVINSVNSLIPSWLKDILDQIGLGDDAQNAQDTVRRVVNDARNWLNGQVDSVRNQINGVIGQFIEMVKNAYMTGGEINQAIDNAANWLKEQTDRLANFLNDKIGEFKGQILGRLEWTRNIRIPDWARRWFNAPDWNLYDHAIVGLVNGLASGASNAVNGASNFFKDTISVVKPLAQGAVAAIVDAIFGDKTGNLYNQIKGINQEIDNIRNTVKKTIDNQTARFKADLDKMLGDLGREGKQIFDTLMNFSNSPTAQIGMAVLEVILGMIPGVGQAIDIKDTAVSLYDILVQGKRGVEDFIGLIGALAGWVPGVGDAIKSVGKVAMKGADFLVPLLKNLGPDVTQTVIKTIGDLDWGKILTDVVNDVIRRWDDVVRVLDRSAGWILESLGAKPAMAMAGGVMLNFRKGTDDVAGNLNQVKKTLTDGLKDGQKEIFNGILRGVKIELPNVIIQRTKIYKVSDDILKSLRNAFNNSIRGKFASSLVDDPIKLESLRKAGLNENDILRLSDGKIPIGWQVHHKLPLEFGGDNSFDNLVLIKNDPYHKVLTNAQRELSSQLSEGDELIADWPFPDGFVYPL